MPVSEIDLAYFAGLFDGEGCICICHQKPRMRKDRHCRNGTYWSRSVYTLSLSLAMTDADVVSWIHQSFGGNFYPRRMNHGTNAPMYAWMAAANEAVRILRSILPYLRVKRKQAEIAIEFQEGKIRRNGRSLPEEEVMKRHQYWEQLRKEKRPWLLQ